MISSVATTLPRLRRTNLPSLYLTVCGRANTDLPLRYRFMSSAKASTDG